MTVNPLPFMEDIPVIAKNESEENAIFIAQTGIACLNNLYLEGDVPDDISDTE
jgi:hypothetical protein